MFKGPGSNTRCQLKCEERECSAPSSKLNPWYISARSLQCQQNILKLLYILIFSQKIFSFKLLNVHQT